MQVYIPPSDKEVQTKILAIIKGKITDKKSRNKRHKFIFMGDFNTILDIDLDKRGANNHSGASRHILEYFISQGFIDTYRKFFPNSRAYTWKSKDNKTASRIDYIWVSPNCDHFIIDADIKESKLVTDSDHLITYCAIDCSTLIRNRRQTNARINSHPRRIFNYELMDEDKWRNFTESLNFHHKMDDFIDGVDEILLDKSFDTITVEDLSSLWDLFTKAIDQVAELSIPSSHLAKVIIQTAPNKDPDPKRVEINKRRKDVKKLRILLKVADRQLGSQITDAQLLEGNILIEKINFIFKVQIPSLRSEWDLEWCSTTKRIIRCINKELSAQLNQYNAVKIKEQIDKRCEFIATNQRALVHNLLNKPFRSIKLDRAVITNEDGELELITEPAELKELCDTEYSKTFRKRNHLFDSDNSIWND